MKYKYKIQTNNLCYGVMTLVDNLTLNEAREYIDYFNKYGITEIKKYRVED